MSVHDRIARHELSWRLRALWEWAAITSEVLELEGQQLGLEAILTGATLGAERDPAGFVRELSVRFELRGKHTPEALREGRERVGQRWTALGGVWVGGIFPERADRLYLRW